MIHWAVVAMLSWLSFKADSLERTASSLYAMVADRGGCGVGNAMRPTETSMSVEADRVGVGVWAASQMELCVVSLFNSNSHLIYGAVTRWRSGW